MSSSSAISMVVDHGFLRNVSRTCHFVCPISVRWFLVYISVLILILIVIRMDDRTKWLMRDYMRKFGNPDTEQLLKKIEDMQRIKNMKSEDFFIEASAELLKQKGFKIVKIKKRR